MLKFIKLTYHMQKDYMVEHKKSSSWLKIFYLKSIRTLKFKSKNFL